jgi:hypothetical protein
VVEGVLIGTGFMVITTGSLAPTQSPFTGVMLYASVVGNALLFVIASVRWKAFNDGTFTPAVAGPAPSGSGHENVVAVGNPVGESYN